VSRRPVRLVLACMGRDTGKEQIALKRKRSAIKPPVSYLFFHHTTGSNLGSVRACGRKKFTDMALKNQSGTSRDANGGVFPVELG